MSFLTLLKKPENIFYFLFPIIRGYLTANICPMNSNSGSKIKFRPPGYIFGIVWPILYLLLGAAWIYWEKYKQNYIGAEEYYDTIQMKLEKALNKKQENLSREQQQMLQEREKLKILKNVCSVIISWLKLPTNGVKPSIQVYHSQ